MIRNFSGDPMDVMMGEAAAGGEETATAEFTEDFRPDSTLLEKGKAEPSKGVRQPSKKKRGSNGIFYGKISPFFS